MKSNYIPPLCLVMEFKLEENFTFSTTIPDVNEEDLDW